MGKLDKSALAGALMLGAMSGEALAEDKATAPFQLAAVTSQQVDCVAYAKQGNTRTEKKSRLKECRLGKLQTDNEVLDARIAEQQRILKALNVVLAKQQMRIDEQGRILNELGEELARIVAINGKLIVRRQQAEQRTAQILDEIEDFIQSRS